MRAVVETPVGSEYKYLLNDNTPELWVSRVLQNDRTFPYNYGFFPGTLEEDGDPLDCFIVGPMLLPHSNVDVEVIGGLEVIDDRGRDTKLICSPVGYSTRVSVNETIVNIKHFLAGYKYETEKVTVGGVLNRQTAELVYENAVKAFSDEKAQQKELVRRFETEMYEKYS